MNLVLVAHFVDDSYIVGGSIGKQVVILNYDCLYIYLSNPIPDRCKDNHIFKITTCLPILPLTMYESSTK